MTLKDVALKANCSVATVSKALKNSSEISSDAKQRILAVAKECGYLKKATTRTAVLGGFKTVIFNDVKGEFLKLYSDLQKLAKKQGLIALYVSISEKDSLELMGQLGALGLIIKGGSSASANEKVFVLNNELSDVVPFLKEITAFMPKRPSRAASSETKKKVKKPAESNKKKAIDKAKKQEPVVQKKEEIWLL
ncbi:MAG: LacI family DNA-binding transcriptional regulator [Clostridia bacterium]|nr:LacI family DNA-binding transcriptional regulator [Clostridia bacterium]